MTGLFSAMCDSFETCRTGAATGVDIDPQDRYRNRGSSFL